MDFNCFYSSLAQSTAAFVGLLGAFIITKIVNNEQNFSKNKENIAQEVIYFNSLKRKLLDRKFSWYNKSQREDVLNAIREDFYNDEELITKDTKEIIRSYNFSPFDNLDEIITEIELLKRKKSK